MKKIKALSIIATLAALSATNAFAASGSLSVSTSNVYVGDSFTVNVNASGIAAWNVHVTANGPVGNCIINQADATADANNTNKTFSTQCTATGTGIITLTLTGDVTSAEGDNVSLSGVKTVTVSEKPASTPTQQNPSTQPQSQSQSQTQAPSQSQTPAQAETEALAPEEAKSNNSNFKEFSVENYGLTKVNDKSYTLAVPSSTEKIIIHAAAEDEKATVKGAGEHTLEEGENTIEIVVIAEDGTKNKITLTVTRDEKCVAAAAESKDNNNMGLIIALIASLVFNLGLATVLIILLTKTKKPKEPEPDSNPFLTSHFGGPQNNPPIYSQPTDKN